MNMSVLKCERDQIFSKWQQLNCPFVTKNFLFVLSFFFIHNLGNEIVSFTGLSMKQHGKNARGKAFKMSVKTSIFVKM